MIYDRYEIVYHQYEMIYNQYEMIYHQYGIVLQQFKDYTYSKPSGRVLLDTFVPADFSNYQTKNISI